MRYRLACSIFIFFITLNSINSFAQQIYNPAAWTERVEKAWGVGRPTEEKLALFDTVWGIANRHFPYFVTKPFINWDSLRTVFRPQIQRGIGQGKFMAIMSRLVYHLNDVHVSFTDRTFTTVLGEVYGVSGTTRLLVFAAVHSETFGICLTALPDGSAMVYEAETVNPLSLKRGDIIVGYNGIPWGTLLPTLINSDLPILGVPGSTLQNRAHRLTSAVLANWHLFDSINILRAGERQITSLPTTRMSGWYGKRLLCTESLPVSGVPRMTWDSFYQQRNEAIFGKITDTNIGYIYAHRCFDSLPRQFWEAVVELTDRNPSDALIIDLRRNDGGYLNAFGPGWAQLYDQSVRWLSIAIRDSNNQADRNALIRLENLEPVYEQGITTAPERFYTWYKYRPRLFDKPIAVLAGPGSASAGDMFVHLFRYHPRARIFGKPSNGAFGGRLPWKISNDTVNIAFTMPDANFYDVRTKKLLGGATYPIDEEVWLTPKNVIQGFDDVVEAAIRWISVNAPSAIPSFADTRAFPNPFTNELSVRLSINRPQEKVLIRLSSILGQEITSYEQEYEQGDHVAAVSTSALARGVYLLTIQTRDKREIIKVVKN